MNSFVHGAPPKRSHRSSRAPARWMRETRRRLPVSSASCSIRLRTTSPRSRRLSYVTTDDEEAVRLARQALVLEEHEYNRGALVQALLRFEDVAHVAEAAGEAERLLESDDVGSLATAAMAGLRAENIDLMQRAVTELDRVGPDALQTHYFAGVLAALSGEFEEAETRIDRALELGLPREAAEWLLSDSGIRSRARASRWFRYGIYLALAWAAGLGILVAVGIALSRVTLRAIETHTPDATGAPSSTEQLIRRVYRFVLGITSAYFYVSQPFVFLLVLGIAAGLAYAVLALGYIPIKLALIVIVLVLVTLWSMLKGLIARSEDEDPGPRLEESEAPSFFRVLREVAAKVGTPPVDSVYVVPDATVAVFERGSTFSRAGHRGERCMILGVGALDGMRLPPFRAILAHEYGHFSHGDTAGGGLALQVRRSIQAGAMHLASSGAAAWYNPAWLFLVAFHRIYLRISHGASRLQEVLADRRAALAYGADAFAEGLQHITRRAVEFPALADREIGKALSEERSLRNLYALTSVPAGDEDSADQSTSREIDDAFEEAMASETSPYDSHPAPRQRIAWVSRLETVASGSYDSEEDLWSLFLHREQLQERMTRLVQENVAGAIAAQQEYEQDVEQWESDDEEVTTLDLSAGSPSTPFEGGGDGAK